MKDMLSCPQNIPGARLIVFGLIVLATNAVAQPPRSRFASSAIPIQRHQEPFPAPETLSPQPSSKQKQELLKSSFEKMKRDADELAALANSLQEDLGKSNQHVLSLKIVNKAEKIEKLAKRIKEAAKGY